MTTTAEAAKDNAATLREIIASHHEDAGRYSTSAYVYLKAAEDPCEGDCDDENGCQCDDPDTNRKKAEIYAMLAHTAALSANAVAIVLSTKTA